MAARFSRQVLNALPLHRATVATLLAGVLVSILLHQALHTLEWTRNAYDFDRRHEVRVALVKRSFEEASEALRVTKLLFQSAESVSDAQFAKFTQPLIDSRPYLYGLLAYRFVRADQRAAYEAERRRTWPDFEIREKGAAGFVRAGARPVYLVLDQATSTAGAALSRGYDIWSFPPHRMHARRTIDSGMLDASGLIPLIERPDRLGVVIAMALYGPLPPNAAVAQRRAAARGIAEVLVDIATVVEENLKRYGMSSTSGIEVSLAGQVNDSARMREVGRFGALPAGLEARWGDLVGAATFDRTERFTIGGQAWELRTRGREPALSHLASTLALVAGLAFSLAAAASVHARANRARRIEALVEERTADLKRASEALRLHQRAIESSANAVILVDALAPDAPIIHVNPAFERLHGRTAAEVVGRPLATLSEGAEDQPGLHELRVALREQREQNALLHLKRRDGSRFHAEVYLSPVRDAAGRTDHFVVFEYDVTRTRQYEADLEHRARHDSLTGLPNRVSLADRIERAIALARSNGAPAWIVALDLDHFRHVNDSLGPAAGDRLLRQVGQRMLALTGPADTVARIGDDEFVLLIENQADERQAASTVNAVLAALAAPFTEGGQRVFLTCSAGIAGCPADGVDADSLVKHAQIAMVRAKESGRNTVRFFLPSMNERAMERLALIDAMRHAMSFNEFELHYQPQVELASGAVIGMEALIRWRHPQLGMLRPERFIALAEDTGLIVPLGTWALRAACAQAAAWQRGGLGLLRIAVNLSSRQFKDAALPRLVASILLETGLAPTSLEIELTESLMMENVEVAVATMRELKAMGVQLSIDDFGTGYSSLSYLKRFPVDVLKIDQSFVRDIGHDSNSSAMVAAMISLSHELGLRVIAEGVETRAQLDYLRERRCDEVQGYFFSQALPGRDFERLLKDRRYALP